MGQFVSKSRLHHLFGDVFIPKQPVDGDATDFFISRHSDGTKTPPCEPSKMHLQTIRDPEI